MAKTFTNRARSQALLKKLVEAKDTGNRTCRFQVSNIFGPIIHRKCNHTWAAATNRADGWTTKGLFVAEADVITSYDYVRIVYEMGCGLVAYLVVPRMTKKEFKIQYKPCWSAFMFGEHGFYVPFEKWDIACTNVEEDLVEKNGRGKSHHFAFRVS